MKAKEIILNCESGYGGWLCHQPIVILNNLDSQSLHLKTKRNKFINSKVPPRLTFSLMKLYLIVLSLYNQNAVL